MCPVGHRALGLGRLCCHCLLLEAGGELALVDTGFGLQDIARPRPRLSGLFVALDRPQFDPSETAVAQVRERGFSPADVRHIVMTHLDFDHAGGIADFPHATVHVLADEAAAARRRRGFIARRRYRPAQWRAASQWQEYRPEGEAWFGFAAVRALRGLTPDILLIPLPGHTDGHCGVAVHSGAGWLLHAGDAYFDHAELDPAHPSCPPGKRGYQWLMQTSGAQRHANRQRLRDLAAQRAGEVEVFCSHDEAELMRLCQPAAPTRAQPPA